MSSMQSKSVKLLENWLISAKKYFYTPAETPDIMCYGTGESFHWAVQTNTNTFGALAVLAMAPQLDEKHIGMSREALQQTALKILRYTLRTHKCSNLTCSNNKQWGMSWISGLSLERMRHGLDCIEELLTDRDKAELRNVMTAESNFLLDEYEINAGLGYYENRPESNMWNGAVLLRTATDYPDTPRREEYLAKARKFFINSISVAADADSTEIFGGEMVKDLFVGGNFTENYSLNHNGYQNMGYAALTLSNAGFLHFSFKKRGIELPAEVYRHTAELWNVLKNFFYPDGRLFRPGGDGRARYCYCQDYAVPAWLFAMDRFGDKLAAQYEARWMDIIASEAEGNNDGAFLSERLKNMRAVSPFYYTRLEGDRAVSTSYGIYWRNAGLLRDITVGKNDLPVSKFNWNDTIQMVTVDKNDSRAASMTWDACFKPVALFTPAKRSDMVEWHHNLTGEVLTSNITSAEIKANFQQNFTDGFVNSGAVDITEKSPFGEGELEDVFARQMTAYAALPDGKSAIILQFAKTSRRIYLRRIQGMGYKMPNDIFNGRCRSYKDASGREYLLKGYPGKEETIHIDSPSLSVDDALFMYNIYGGEGFTVYRPQDQQIRMEDFTHTTIYADEICTQFEYAGRFAAPGEKVLDCGFALSVDKNAVSSVKQLALDDKLRGVEVVCGRDTYVFIANTAEENTVIPAEFAIMQTVDFNAVPDVLQPYQALLLKK